MKKIIVILTSMMRKLKLVWWVVKLFALAYGVLFFRSSYFSLSTVWAVAFLSKKGFLKCLLLPIMTGLCELEWRSYFDSFIRFAKTFIGVGATADGYYSFRAFKRNKCVKIIALEPLQLEFKYLVKNV